MRCLVKALWCHITVLGANPTHFVGAGTASAAADWASAQPPFPRPAPAPLLLPNTVSGPSGAGGEQELKEALTWLVLARWPAVQQMRMILWWLEILSLVLLSSPSLA